VDLAVRAARAAGGLLLERFGTPATGLASKTSRTDLVSDADRDAERLITAMLRAERPDDALQGEEGASERGRSGVRWLVDPLDGTVNYLWGIPQWSVSVAASDEEGPSLGVVYDPSRGETFTAVRGQGARLDGRPLVLGRGPSLEEALVGTGFSYRAAVRAEQAEILLHVVARVRDIRRLGSAALDLAWVGAGRLDGFYEWGLSPWDWAAGAMVVREAGGTFEEIPPEGDRPPGVLAGAPGVSGPLRGLLGDAGVAWPA
jgi:myo-inositol-1(or 4)-monophosphatase